MSIRKTCSGLQTEVIVVDGGSFDACKQMLATEFPEALFVQAHDNIGFGRSNNLGFAEVTGDAVLLLNPDTELYESALQTLLDQLLALPSVGIVGPRLLNCDGSIQSGSIHVLPTPLTEAFSSEFMRRWMPKSRLGANAALLNVGAPVEVEAIAGACIMLPTEVFRKVGGFTERYFMYAEDMDLCLKVRNLGLRIYHVPSARVLHHGGGSSRLQFSKFSVVMMREAVYTYMVINHGMFKALQYRIAMLISAAVRLGLLSFGWSVTRGEKRASRVTSLRKWQLVLNWSLGKESWVKKYWIAGSHDTSATNHTSDSGSNDAISRVR
ncbi:MAG: glycosyl transferase family 2 [Chthoniobacteraceae bacterium]|nr:glycosyl transferase family 2 [Chthoniobacteraceae bacterium]